ncbi:MAG: hypothetical protein LBJ32_01845, partial [Oscillospiraceae bacterium]|nr:hypothetical protein [Oscillospiraceae bacterium]
SAQNQQGNPNPPSPNQQSSAQNQQGNPNPPSPNQQSSAQNQPSTKRIKPTAEEIRMLSDFLKEQASKGFYLEGFQERTMQNQQVSQQQSTQNVNPTSSTQENQSAQQTNDNPIQTPHTNQSEDFLGMSEKLKALIPECELKEKYKDRDIHSINGMRISNFYPDFVSHYGDEEGLKKYREFDFLFHEEQKRAINIRQQNQQTNTNQPATQSPTEKQKENQTPNQSLSRDEEELLKLEESSKKLKEYVTYFEKRLEETKQINRSSDIKSQAIVREAINDYNKAKRAYKTVNERINTIKERNKPKEQTQAPVNKSAPAKQTPVSTLGGLGSIKGVNKGVVQTATGVTPSLQKNEHKEKQKDKRHI